MLNRLYNFFAIRSGLYQEEVERNRELTDQFKELNQTSKDLESRLETERIKTRRLERRVGRLTEAQENYFNITVIKTLIKKSQAPLVYATAEGQIAFYNQPSEETLGNLVNTNIEEVDLKDWVSIPLENVNGKVIGEIYGYKVNKKLLEKMHGIYKFLIGERKTEEMINLALPSQQNNS